LLTAEEGFGVRAEVRALGGQPAGNLLTGASYTTLGESYGFAITAID
jgi:hypothetical protein